MKYLAPFWSCGGFRWDRHVWHICADRGNVTSPFRRIIEMTPLQSRDRIIPLFLPFYLQWYESVYIYVYTCVPLFIYGPVEMRQARHEAGWSRSPKTAQIQIIRLWRNITKIERAIEKKVYVARILPRSLSLSVRIEIAICVPRDFNSFRSTVRNWCVESVPRLNRFPGTNFPIIHIFITTVNIHHLVFLLPPKNSKKYISPKDINIKKYDIKMGYKKLTKRNLTTRNAITTEIRLWS